MVAIQKRKVSKLDGWFCFLPAILWYTVLLASSSPYLILGIPENHQLSFYVILLIMMAIGYPMVKSGIKDRPFCMQNKMIRKIQEAGGVPQKVMVLAAKETGIRALDDDVVEVDFEYKQNDKIIKASALGLYEWADKLLPNKCVVVWKDPRKDNVFLIDTLPCGEVGVD